MDVFTGRRGTSTEPERRDGAVAAQRLQNRRALLHVQGREGAGVCSTGARQGRPAQWRRFNAVGGAAPAHGRRQELQGGRQDPIGELLEEHDARSA